MLKIVVEEIIKILESEKRPSTSKINNILRREYGKGGKIYNALFEKNIINDEGKLNPKSTDKNYFWQEIKSFCDNKYNISYVIYSKENID